MCDNSIVSWPTALRAWAAGAGPGDQRLVVDVDSFVGEVHGHAKQGAGFAYTGRRGYHPILATRAGTGEVLHIRARKGSANTARGALRFVEELIARVDRAGAEGPKLLRADSGFQNKKLMARLHAAGWAYSIGVRQRKHIKTAIAAIEESTWQPLVDYPKTAKRRSQDHARRRSAPGRPAHPAAGRPGRAVARLAPLRVFDQPRRAAGTRRSRAPPARRRRARHPRSQRPSAGALPSSKFMANTAWTVIATLAHNLLRWTHLLALPDQTIRAARTLRRRLLTIPGRLARTARTTTLRMPARWPWAHDFLPALTRIRALPPPT
jgi:hypothetical protein